MNISKLNEQIDVIDLFICSVSFEERACKTSEVIDVNKVNNALVVYNEDEKDCFESNLMLLSEKWNKNSSSLGVSFKDPSNIADILGGFFESFFKVEKGTILLDCTTFTHEGLLIILRFLDNYKDKFSKLKIVYVCAEEYSFDESNEGLKWLTKGIRSIKTVLGYPGIFVPSKQNHLIVLFGFEVERTIKLIEEMDFDKITLCFGSASDSINTKHYNINKKRHEKLSEFYPNADKLEISLRNPQKTKEIILGHVNTDNYNVVVAPMNNKLSTIGAALAAIKNPKIQLIYTKAKEYNIHAYSKSSNEIYLFDIDINVP